MVETRFVGPLKPQTSTNERVFIDVIKRGAEAPHYPVEFA